MKNFVKVTAVMLLLGSFGLESCKKGENDPFLSLHSRKGRVTGEWKVTAGSGASTNPSISLSSTWTYDGASLVTVSTISPFPAQTTTEAKTMSYTFEKDGTFTMVETTTTGNNVETVTTTGTWNFTGRVGDDKNKDHIVLRTLSETTTETSPSSSSVQTYTGDNAPSSIFYIDELKNKEMIIKWDGTSQSGSTAASTNSGSYTLTQ